MASVILAILGVIGKVLLILLYIVLILLALVLLVPIRYDVKADVQDSVRARGQASWLFRLLRVLFKYDTAAEQDKRFHIQIRLAGHVLYDNLKPRGRKKHRKGKTDKQLPQEDAQAHSKEAEKTGSAQTPDADAETEKEQTGPETDNTMKTGEAAPEGSTGGKKETSREQTAKDNGQKKHPSGRAQNRQRPSFMERLKGRLRSLQEKAEAIRKKKDQVMVIINNPDNRICISRIFRNLKKLLYRLRPQLQKLYLHFGFEDPATTGKMLGAVSWLYPFCTDAMEVVPEFQTEKAIFAGCVRVTGRIRLIWAAVFAVTSLLNRKFFRLVKQIKNIL